MRFSCTPAAAAADDDDDHGLLTLHHHAGAHSPDALQVSVLPPLPLDSLPLPSSGGPLITATVQPAVTYRSPVPTTRPSMPGLPSYRKPSQPSPLGPDAGAGSGAGAGPGAGAGAASVGAGSSRASGGLEAGGGVGGAGPVSASVRPGRREGYSINLTALGAGGPGAQAGGSEAAGGGGGSSARPPTVAPLTYLPNCSDAVLVSPLLLEQVLMQDASSQLVSDARGLRSLHPH